MKKTKLFIILFFIFILFPFTCNSQTQNVIIVEINGTIDQYAVEIVKQSIDLAELENSEAIILLLDTPGGGLTETFEIADLIKESKIPFVGFVYPPGSTAWSAGTFILMSTHVAAMSEHTLIGSCQPVEVSISGSNLINDSKTINALTKWLEERAEMFERNRSIARLFITENLNLNETLAIEYNVIEFISSSVEQLIQDINGFNIKTSKGNFTLNTKYAKQIKYEPSIGIIFMKFFSNPILTSLLFTIGIFSLIFGISSPGYGAEAFGVIAILLSLIGSGFSLPLLALIFIIIGAILLLIEIFVIPGFGVVGISGVIALIVGSIFLIPDYRNRNWLISMNIVNEIQITVFILVIFIAAFFAFLLYKILEARKKRIAIGLFVGEMAETVDRITPAQPGYVRYKGELWKATSDFTIEKNKKVIIIDKEESILKVKPKDD